MSNNLKQLHGGKQDEIDGLFSDVIGEVNSINGVVVIALKDGATNIEVWSAGLNHLERLGLLEKGRDIVLNSPTIPIDDGPAS